MHSPANYHVTVFGGTGFLGRNLVNRLLRRGYRVRVAVRNPRQDLFQDTNNRLEQVQSDVRNAQSVADAIKDTDGVVNAVGLYVESQSATFEAVHVVGAQNIAQQSVTCGQNWRTYPVSVPIPNHRRLISGPGLSGNSGCAKQRRKQLF